MSRGPPIGELVVVALKAEKLQHQAPRKQDPFCLFRVGDVVKRTKIDNGGGQYPIWDDQVNIPVTAGYHQMVIQIFDKEANPKNLMAEGIVDLTKVLNEKEHDGYFPLSFRGRPESGFIYLELTFYSTQNAAARPLQQVRYQYPPGHVPNGGNFRPPPSPYHRPPPPPLSQMQHNRPPSSHMQHNRPPPMHMQPTTPQQRPQMYPQQRPLPQPPIQHRPPPMQPYPPAQPRHSQSMGTAQVFSQSMSLPQPLLSAPYNPAPSPAQRPANLNYPSPNNNHRQSYAVSPYPPPQQPHYPPEPPTHVLRPMAPGGFSAPARPNHNSYPPY